MPKSKRISGGVIAAAISPRRDMEHSIDLGASLELIDFLNQGGVDGIALLGSNGEFVHFMLEDRARMLDFAVKRSRLPVIVNVSHSTLDGAVYLADEAAGSGVAAVLIMPPYFYDYAQHDLVAFCLRFGDRVAKQTPVYLENEHRLSAESIDTLLASGVFAGLVQHGEISPRSGGPEQIFSGNDRLLATFRSLGAQGTVSPAACAVPELVVKLDRATASGDTAKVRRLEDLLGEFLDWLDRFPTPIGCKEAVKHRKIAIGAHSIPLSAETSRKLLEFGEWFRHWLPGALKA